MTTRRLAIASALALSFSAPFFLSAQQPAAPAQGQRGGGRGPQQPMSFFVTSTNIGRGGDLGGLAGADAHCQALATAAGSTKTWRAYLSTQGTGAVNARDRIGSGPWHNARGAAIARDLSHLHGDTLDEARLGNNISKMTALSEKAEAVMGFGDATNQHDILTGTMPDGKAYTDNADHTCSNWTSSASTGRAQLGHHDRTGGGSTSWNSVHSSRGCAQPELVQSGGNGYLYCFAIN